MWLGSIGLVLWTFIVFSIFLVIASQFFFGRILFSFNPSGWDNMGHFQDLKHQRTKMEIPQWSIILPQPGGHNLRILMSAFGRVSTHRLVPCRESLPEHLANSEGERTERSRMSPDDRNPNPKQIPWTFQFHEPTNFFLCFSRFHMSFLSFTSKRVLLIERVWLTTPIQSPSEVDVAPWSV